jgi:hypothetical protein
VLLNILPRPLGIRAPMPERYVCATDRLDDTLIHATDGACDTTHWVP